MGVWKFYLSTKHQVSYDILGVWCYGLRRDLSFFACLFICFSFIWEFLIYFPKRVDMTTYIARQLNKQVHKEIIPLIYFNGNSMRILFFKVDYMV